MTTIVFSNGTLADIEKLGLFELDRLKPEPMGPFTYKTTILDKEYDVEFRLDHWDNMPEKPDIPESEIEPDSREADELKTWKLYQAALEHERKRKRQMVDFLNRVVEFIIERHSDLIPHIKTQEDWEKLYEAVLVEPVTADLLTRILKETYSAHFDGQDIFDAMANFAEDHAGQYDNIRLWENQLMLEMKMTEAEYVLLDVEERARKICALFLPKIMESLEFYRRREREKREKNKNGTS